MATPKVTFADFEFDIDELCAVDIPPLPTPAVFKPLIAMPVAVAATNDQSVPMDCTPD